MARESINMLVDVEGYLDAEYQQVRMAFLIDAQNNVHVTATLRESTYYFSFIYEDTMLMRMYSGRHEMIYQMVLEDNTIDQQEMESLVRAFVVAHRLHEHKASEIASYVRLDRPHML